MVEGQTVLHIFLIYKKKCFPNEMKDDVGEHFIAYVSTEKLTLEYKYCVDYK